MLKYVKGDLLSATEGYIVHGCNCQGAMGSGVALAIKNKYPKAYQDYMDFYMTRDYPLGSCNLSRVNSKLAIVNAFTQEYYGRDGKQYASYSAIADVMYKLANNISIDEPIHMPKIGCGLGGASWETVEKLILKSLHNHDVTIYEL